MQNSVRSCFGTSARGAYACAAMLLLMVARAGAAPNPSVSIASVTPANPVTASQLTVSLTAEGTPSGCTLALVQYGANTAPIAKPLSTFPATVTLPLAGVAPGYYAVQAYCETNSAATAGDMKTVYIGGEPAASGFSPATAELSTGAAAGTAVTINGNWFGSIQAGGYVRLIGSGVPDVYIANVKSWSNSSIVFVVPEYAMPGQYRVSVTAAGYGGVTQTTAPGTLTVTAAFAGWVDLHAHPYANLGFGGKLIYGSVDDGSVVNGLVTDPAGSQYTLQNPQLGQCGYKSAASIEDALGHEDYAHGAVTPTNLCGDDIRVGYIPLLEAMTQDAAVWDPLTYQTAGFQGKESQGVQDFPTWPAWNDLLNQHMYYEWIFRSYQGGQRVLVALSVNSKLMGDMTRGSGDLADDDLTTGDVQLNAMKALINSKDFMQVALNSNDVLSAVTSGKMAVVLGVELDNFGNITEAQCPVTMTEQSSQFAGCLQQYQQAVDHLFSEGVRYIFPIHLVDNPLGGTAVYNSFFDIANEYEEGTAYSMGCSQQSDGISFMYSAQGPWVKLLELPKLGTNTPAIPGAQNCPQPSSGAVGNVNNLGLTPLGKQVIQYIMSKPMLIDVDHMSQKSVADVLNLAQAHQPYKYPVFSGHNGVRSMGSGPTSERNFTEATYGTIGSLHGMAGVGSSDIDASAWYSMFNAVVEAMGPVAGTGFGTDANGMALLMKPRGSSITYPLALSQLPMSSDGNQKWDYNKVGVAHYGMLPDFLQDVTSLSGGKLAGSAVVSMMNNGANYFYETWRIVEGNAPGGPTPASPAPLSPPPVCPGMQILNTPGNTGNISGAGPPCVCPPTSSFITAANPGGRQAGTCQCTIAGTTWNRGSCSTPPPPTGPGTQPWGGGTGPSCPSTCKYGCNSNGTCSGAKFQVGLSPGQESNPQ